jgi:hypothetical protein
MARSQEDLPLRSRSQNGQNLSQMQGGVVELGLSGADSHLCFTKTPSSDFRLNAALLHLIAWLPRPQFHLLECR